MITSPPNTQKSDLKNSLLKRQDGDLSGVTTATFVTLQGEQVSRTEGLSV